jgi:hypothetical protein
MGYFTVLVTTSPAAGPWKFSPDCWATDRESAKVLDLAYLGTLLAGALARVVRVSGGGHTPADPSLLGTIARAHGHYR